MAFLDVFTQFGKRKPPEVDLEKDVESFAPKREDDAIVVSAGGLMSRQLNYDASSTNESDLIDTWRELASRAEVDWAIQEIVNEAIVTDYETYPVEIGVGDEDVPEKIKDKVAEEFEHILSVLNFNRDAADIFRKWFVEGKHYYHMVLDPKAPTKGIQAVRWVCPKSIKKIVETETVKDDNGIEIQKVKDVYYQYTNYANPRNMQSIVRSTQAIRVDPNIIAYSNSGLFRERPDGMTIAISHLDKSIKAANQLRLLEDSLIIYRISRAPERRVFYIDVGNLPKTKAEQYLTSVMNKFRTKIVYDSVTGEIKDQRNQLSMVEDYWLPRREGGKGTEVTTLQGGQNLGELDDVDYFYKKLFRSLNIPSTRLQSDSTFNVGRSAEITREEVKFSKFVSYLRSKFSETFIQMLRTQLVAKNIMSAEDFDGLASSITFKWKTDSYWDELMDNEVWQARLALLQQMDPFAGKYFSIEWINKKILKMSDEEIKDMKAQMKKEPKPKEPDESIDDEDFGGIL